MIRGLEVFIVRGKAFPILWPYMPNTATVSDTSTRALNGYG